MDSKRIGGYIIKSEGRTYQISNACFLCTLRYMLPILETTFLVKIRISYRGDLGYVNHASIMAKKPSRVTRHGIVPSLVS